MRGREDPGQQQVWPDVKLHGSAAQQSMGKAVLCREADEVARGEAAAQPLLFWGSSLNSAGDQSLVSSLESRP